MKIVENKCAKMSLLVRHFGSKGFSNKKVSLTECTDVRIKCTENRTIKMISSRRKECKISATKQGPRRPERMIPWAIKES